MNIIVVPKGSGSVQNYKKTINSKVDISQFNHLINSDIANESFVWGLNITSNSSVKKFQKISKNDLVLFVSNNKVDGDKVLSAFVVRDTFVSKEASTKFWGTEKYKKILILDETQYNFDNQKFTYTGLARKTGYVKDDEKSKSAKPSNSAIVLPNSSNSLSEKVISEIYEIIMQNSEFKIIDNKLVLNIDGEEVELTQREITDARREVKTRLEQSDLRNKLINNRVSANCTICNIDYPVEFLHASHIKKRVECSPGERNDKNVATLMCIFGCDALFEKKIIYVTSEGTVRKSLHHKSMLDAIDKYTESLVKYSVVDVNNKNSKYYDWHRVEANKK